MADAPESRFAVSTWSLHHLIDNGGAGLMDMPSMAAARGIGRLEVCHFHFPNTEAQTVRTLKARLADSGVQFFTLLIDFGDITHPDPQTRAAEIEEIGKWIDLAGAAGAERVRIIGGKQPPDPAGDNLRLSAEGFRILALRARDAGVKIVTENWQALLATPSEVLGLLAILDGEIGLMADFGNWPGARKYDDLAQIIGKASSTHAKVEILADGSFDWADYKKCLDLCKDAGFGGPHSLIYDGPGDEWAKIAELREFVQPYVTA